MLASDDNTAGLVWFGGDGVGGYFMGDTTTSHESGNDGPLAVDALRVGASNKTGRRGDVLASSAPTAHSDSEPTLLAVNSSVARVVGKWLTTHCPHAKHNLGACLSAAMRNIAGVCESRCDLGVVVIVETASGRRVGRLAFFSGRFDNDR